MPTRRFTPQGIRNANHLPGARLPGANLPGANLPGANLPGANLPGAEAGPDREPHPCS